MCGIWGFASCDASWQNESYKKIARRLFYYSEKRGKEAAGLAIANDDGLHVYKRALAASQMIKTVPYQQFITKALDMPRTQGICLIGHSRLVTNGTQLNDDNNQPVAKHTCVTVHNGIIVNGDAILKKYPQLQLQSDVDTEIFVELLLHFCKQHSLPVAISKTYEELYGMANTLNFLGDTNQLIAATNNGSLSFCLSKDGKSVLFASEKITLQQLIQTESILQSAFSAQDVSPVPLNCAQVFSLQTMQCTSFDMTQNTADIQLPPPLTKTCTLSIDRDIAGEKSVFSNIQLTKTNLKEFEIDEEPIRKLRRCTRCVLPETMPFIEFDKDGVCNYCHTYKKQKTKSVQELHAWADSIRSVDGRADSIISFSGGRDSSYGMHYFVKELGLHPIAYGYDWGMVTDLARRNQSRMCAALGVELIVVSANLEKKRSNIRKNVLAWLKKPDLGMIPIFMAGDKQYFYYANKVRKEYNLQHVLMASNPFEITHFKSGFCGVKPAILRSKEHGEMEHLPVGSVLRMAGHYAGQYLKNPSYINRSLLDTASATASYYMIPHEYMRLFNYLPWQEDVVNDTLLNEYDWETSPDTNSTWRIGDGTAPFYNYIYYLVAGFTENDTLRSNQIREGLLSREEALKRIYQDNAPRFDSLKWYFDIESLDMSDVLKRIQEIPRLYTP